MTPAFGQERGGLYQARPTKGKPHRLTQATKAFAGNKRPRTRPKVLIQVSDALLAKLQITIAPAHLKAAALVPDAWPAKSKTRPSAAGRNNELYQHKDAPVGERLLLSENPSTRFHSAGRRVELALSKRGRVA